MKDRCWEYFLRLSAHTLGHTGTHAHTHTHTHTHNHPQPSDGTEQNLVAALFCRLHRAVINGLYYKLKQSAAGDVEVRKCTHGGEPTGNESAN